MVRIESIKSTRSSFDDSTVAVDDFGFHFFCCFKYISKVSNPL